MSKNNEIKVVTPESRLVFPNLFEPTSFEEGGKETYNAVLVFPAGTDITPLLDAVKKSAVAAGLKGGARNPIRDGNEKADDWGEVFKDAKYIRVSSQFEPAVVDRKRQPILDAKQVYSGCYARAAVRCYAYSKLGNSGVSFGFDAIQITRDGEHLGGGSASVSMFGDLPDADADNAASMDDPFAEQ